MESDGLRDGVAVKDSGHTLLEVVVSVLLLAMALVPLVQLYPPVLSFARSQQQTELLASVASGKLEELAQVLRAGGSVAPGFSPCPVAPGCRVVWQVENVQQHPTAGWLRHLRTVACVDGNTNHQCDPGEEQVAYETRVTNRR